MTEMTNPGPSDPPGPTAPTGPVDEGQSLLDAGALEPADGGPGTADDLPGPDALAPQDTSDPASQSGGRGEGAS